MPLDGTQKKLKKDLLNLNISGPRKGPEIVNEKFLDPENHLFSEDPQNDERHEYLMGIWPEEGKTPAQVLEMGLRISKREDCKFSMLEMCNALSELAQAGKVRVKFVRMTNDQFNLYGLWAA